MATIIGNALEALIAELQLVVYTWLLSPVDPVLDRPQLTGDPAVANIVGAGVGLDFAKPGRGKNASGAVMAARTANPRAVLKARFFCIDRPRLKLPVIVPTGIRKPQQCDLKFNDAI
jgi:hypothetical protein